jgi:hypothetical protein
MTIIFVKFGDDPGAGPGAGAQGPSSTARTFIKRKSNRKLNIVENLEFDCLIKF